MAWKCTTAYCVGTDEVATVATREEAIAWLRARQVEPDTGDAVTSSDGRIAVNLTVPGCVQSWGYAREMVEMDDKELTAKLNEHFDSCPQCGSSDVDARDHNGDRVLTCRVDCADCGASWTECYRFFEGCDFEKGDSDD